ncbi:MAG: 50S ribosomal protein L17 [SAR324 cluster bacterium]|nr:50S ribosomal protein L17 [SAR324 cluster bacterium]
MRHLKAGRRLGVTTSHRRAMMRNMVTSILEKGEIRCTLARAKEVRKPLEKMITLAKRGDLHARRQALTFVKSKEAMSQLFDELSERYSDRQGGYCRIIKLGQTRLGDNSEMAIVQLIGSENDQLSSLKSTSGKKKPARKSSKVLEKVSEEVRQAEESSEKAAKEEAVEEKADASEKSEASEPAPSVETETPEQETSAEKTEEQQAKTETPEEEPVQESVQEETEASGTTSDSEQVEASAEPEQTEVSSEPEPDPAENKESKEEK